MSLPYKVVVVVAVVAVVVAVVNVLEDVFTRQQIVTTHLHKKA
jgi:hypothetical protein